MPVDDHGVHTHDFRDRHRCLCGERDGRGRRAAPVVVTDPTTVLRTAAWQAGWDRDEFDRVLTLVKAEVWAEGFNAAGRWLLHAEPSADVAPTNPYRSES